MNRRKGILIGLLLAGLFVCAGAFPLKTRQGVNYQVTTHPIPLAVKGLEFAIRDIRLRQLAAEITCGLNTEEARAAALFNWTQKQIRHTPPGWPVIDDHITHIIIRGYGETDQMADVFTTLSTYAGLPAFWRTARSKSRKCTLILSFVRMNGRWTVWDVAHGGAYRTEQGSLASVEDLAKGSDLEGLLPLEVPETLRAEKQMLGRRVAFELRRGWRSILGLLR